MVRNDYRRSLILLRSNASGYAGHVRLERRTMMGSMYFVVQSPRDGGTLQAVLIGRNRGGYYACPLGMLRSDDERQFSLSVNFDPRNICSRELEDYRLAAVVRVKPLDCRIVLFGNLNGYTDVDWTRATEAACNLFTQPVPPPAPPQNRPAAPDTPILPTPGLPGGEIPAAPDTPILPTPGLPGGETPAAPDTPILPTPGLPGNLAQPGAEGSVAAAAVLGVNAEQSWLPSIEGLREIFRTAPAMEITPDGDYVYVSAPMPAMSGYDSCAVGLRAEDGKIISVRYALPSLYAPEPPAGLEDYIWYGDNSRGWWVREIDLTE